MIIFRLIARWYHSNKLSVSNIYNPLCLTININQSIRYYQKKEYTMCKFYQENNVYCGIYEMGLLKNNDAVVIISWLVIQAVDKRKLKRLISSWDFHDAIQVSVSSNFLHHWRANGLICLLLHVCGISGALTYVAYGVCVLCNHWQCRLSCSGHTSEYLPCEIDNSLVRQYDKASQSVTKSTQRAQTSTVI